jgi:hypothetical protein
MNGKLLIINDWLCAYTKRKAKRINQLQRNRLIIHIAAAIHH